MQTYTLSTPTQLILALIMFGILLTWLIVFTVLALRRAPAPKRQEARDEQPTPAASFPAVNVQIRQSNTVN